MLKAAENVVIKQRCSHEKQMTRVEFDSVENSKCSTKAWTNCSSSSDVQQSLDKIRSHREFKMKSCRANVTQSIRKKNFCSRKQIFRTRGTLWFGNGEDHTNLYCKGDKQICDKSLPKLWYISMIIAQTFHQSSSQQNDTRKVRVNEIMQYLQINLNSE